MGQVNGRFSDRRAACWWSWPGVATLLCLAAVAALNADLYRFFGRQEGAAFGMAPAGLHAFYLLYSGVVFAMVAAQATLSRLLVRARKGG